MTATAVIRYHTWSGGWSLVGAGEARMSVALPYPATWTPEPDDIIRRHLAAFGFRIVSVAAEGRVLTMQLAQAHSTPDLAERTNV